MESLSEDIILIMICPLLFLQYKAIDEYHSGMIIPQIEITMSEDKKTYDEDPVFYCKRCLSLNIRRMPCVDNQDYCGECGTTDIGSADIEEWKEMYKKKYGHDFVQKRVLKWPYWC
jgi:hypothetical protein